MSKKLTCGDCKLLQDCGIRDMNHEACGHIMPWKKADEPEFIEWLNLKKINIPMNDDVCVDDMHSLWRSSM